MTSAVRTSGSPSTPTLFLQDPAPEMQAHLQAVMRGEVKFGTRRARQKQWLEIPRSRKRATLWCRHGLRHESAPRTELGGLTSDRIYSGEDGGRLLQGPVQEVSLRCSTCGTVWLVPLPGLRRLVRDRGHRLLYQLVYEVPGVSIER